MDAVDNVPGLGSRCVPSHTNPSTFRYLHLAIVYFDCGCLVPKAVIVCLMQVLGPINVCAPIAVQNTALMQAIGEVISRPTWFWVPESIAKFFAGEMADELLLSSLVCGLSVCRSVCLFARTHAQ